MCIRKVIDFRVRPPYKSYLELFKNPELTNELLGLDFPTSKSEKNKSVEVLLQELDEAGVEISVLPGRGIWGDQTEELFELAEQYPGRFIVFPYVNPLEGQKALDLVDKYVIHGKGKGVCIEPAFQKDTYWYNDDRVFPLYKMLEENNIPLLITSGVAIPSIDPNSINYLEEVAIKFPDLKLILAHAAWPFTREVIAIAFKHPNVFLIPDVYGSQGPSGDDYIRGANTIIPNQLIYGSSYPVLPIVETVKAYENRPFKNEKIRNKFFYENAARILGI